MDLHFQKKTKRLVIRPYRLTDYELWKETYLNLGEAKNSWDKGKRDKSELTKTIFKKILQTQKKNRQLDSYYDLTAFDKRNGHLIGFASLMDISRGVFQNAYLGYGILNPYWGCGYGKEMVTEVLRIGFRDLGLHRIEAGIDPKNKRSQLLARSVGLRREGLSKRRLFLNNQWSDMVIYAITAEEYGYKGHQGQLRKYSS